MKKKILITTVLICVVLCACTSEPKPEENNQQTIEVTTVKETTTVIEEVKQTTTVEEYNVEQFLNEVKSAAKRNLLPREEITEIKIENNILVINIKLERINKVEEKAENIMNAVLKIEKGLIFWQTITINTSEGSFTKNKEDI